MIHKSGAKKLDLEVGLSQAKARKEEEDAASEEEGKYMAIEDAVEGEK